MGGAVSLASNLTPCVSQFVSAFVSPCVTLSPFVDLCVTTLVTLLHRHLSKCFQGGSIAATLEGLTHIYTKTLSKYACCAFQVLGNRHYLSNVIISGFSNLHLVLGDESLPVGVVRLGAERARVDQALAGIRMMMVDHVYIYRDVFVYFI